MTGSCLCGKIRYQADGELTLMHHCHCQRCRKHHGAAFVTDGLVAASGFRWLAGESELRSYAAPGWQSTRFFCGTCGSSLCTRDTRYPEFVIVTAGTLDDLLHDGQTHAGALDRHVLETLEDLEDLVVIVGVDAKAVVAHVDLEDVATVDGADLDVRISDDGVGFEPASAAGMGLRSITTRVAELGGRTELWAGPGEGTTLAVCLPVSAVH